MTIRYPAFLLTLLLVTTASSQCVTTFPLNEAFTGSTEGTPGTLINNWTNLTGDNLDWWVDKNGTPTAETGPIGDHTSHSTKENYMYVSAAAGSATPNKMAILQSPCMDLTGISSPYLTFWYHMRGNQQGALHVDVNVNGTVTSDAWVVSGDQGLQWKQGWLNLAAYQGQNNLRIRFRAETGSGVRSDIGLDDVFVGTLNAVLGCNESTATNYSPTVNINNNSCDYSCPAGQKRVKIDIVSDNYSYETSWSLKNGSTNTTLASGTSTGTSLCVPANTCLIFRINDTAGDGIYHSSYGYGGYWLYLDGVLVRTGGAFGSFEETNFNCPPGFSCSSALPLSLAPIGSTYPVTLTTFTTTAVEQWYDFTPPQTGAYTISTCGTNSCDTRLWLYDMNCSQLVLSSGIEGATYGDDNDGGCGLQAVVSANMPGGVLHHLRVGDNAGACGGHVTVSITYNGPVTGCMDTQSCNFEPLATVPCTNCCLAFGNPACPNGPDLTLHQPSLLNSLTMQTVNITDPCAPAEGCTKGLGARRVIRFTTRIDNIGTTDYYIGNNSTYPGIFDTNNCHGHAHYAGYADYVLFDQSGTAIPVGFKNGFCVMDIGCTPGHSGQFGCSNMGITAGCYDVYSSGTTCNWIDVTDVPPGTYTLVLRTNWQRAPDALGRHERDYTNNFAQVCINLTASSFSVATDCPPFVDCLGQPYGDARMDCNGVCAGPSKRGDLNYDGNQTQPDASEYVTRILGDDISPSNCNDLNGDNLITVTDAALMVNCFSQQDVHDGSPHLIHYHPWCDFPRGFVSSSDVVELSLANLDPVNHTVDVMIKNASCRVMGYEFNLSGLTIQSAQNLAPNLVGDFTMNTALGGNKVIGLSFVDSSLVKNAVPVPLCRISYLGLTGSTVCITGINDIVNKDANNVTTVITGGCLAVPNTVLVQPMAWLEGPYVLAEGLMHDSLRVKGLIPNLEPYTALGFTQLSGGGGEVLQPGVLNTSGNTAIVDWVLVELRQPTAPYALVATRSALIRRNGSIVGTDGSSPVQFQAAPGNYRVTVRHRNHFGAMTNATVALSGTSATVDFRTTATATHGTNARKAMGAATVLWAGNCRPDHTIAYTGNANDRDPILVVIGGSVATATVIGYYLEDGSMDGMVKYTGSKNDRDMILVNIGGSVATNTITEQMP